MMVFAQVKGRENLNKITQQGVGYMTVNEGYHTT